jgi:phosphatidylinositol phospholipase C, delta
MSSATEDSDGALTSAKAKKKKRHTSKITKPLSDLSVYDLEELKAEPL